MKARARPLLTLPFSAIRRLQVARRRARKPPPVEPRPALVKLMLRGVVVRL